MTTKLIILNGGNSNGDVIIGWDTVSYVDDPNRNGDGTKTITIYPGDQPVTIGITTETHLTIHEEWPTKKPAPICREPCTGPREGVMKH